MLTITQFEYIIALERYKNFSEAAKQCYVTQPTLSMQIQKLEDYLQVTIFDRSRKPVVPTSIGKEIIEQAKKVLQQVNGVQEIIQSHKGELKGEFHLGIIPSVSESLTPKFLGSFIKLYPKVELHIHELQTDLLIEKIRKEDIDAGVAATPLEETYIKEEVLYYEELYLYLYQGHRFLNKDNVKPDELDINEILVMAEGHCFKNQSLQLCKMKSKSSSNNVMFESNSFQTLINLVDQKMGVTLLPKLIIDQFNEKKKRFIRPFSGPPPTREISLLSKRNILKQGIRNAIKQQIKAQIRLQSPKKKTILNPV